jgi:hypothetical protein
MDVPSPVSPPQRGAASDHKSPATCPYCGYTGGLAPLSEDTVIGHNTFISVRRCTNDECRGVVFYYRGREGNVKTLPYRSIDGSKADIPSGVRNALEEATICHFNGCYVAAALMVRRALVDLCDNAGVADGDLSHRLALLGKTLVIPPELLAGLRDLPMLADTAVSSESAIYRTVSREEVQLGIDCAQALLKALYEYKSLVGRLEALKDQRITP